MSELTDRLVRDFGVTDITELKPAITALKVQKEHGERLIRELRDREGFTHLNFITCTDWIEDGIFRLVYMLRNHDTNTNLAVHVDLDRNKAVMTSIHTLWAQAWTYQRELREMYGIDFPGSPRLHEDFCLEGWDNIPPMRRDFDTVKYSAETFGHREGRVSIVPRENMKAQFYPNRGGDEQ
jgi:NADH-quinone oxidoreductase subunit C